MDNHNGQTRRQQFGARILVIDDDPKTLSFCREALTGSFSLIETAGGSAEGLALLADQPFDILLTDLQMPGIDGFELMETIRSRWSGMEIVVMTSFPREDVVDRLLKLGVFSMLVKPFSPQQLFYAVMAASKIVALRRENEALRISVEEHPFGIVGIPPR